VHCPFGKKFCANFQNKLSLPSLFVCKKVFPMHLPQLSLDKSFVSLNKLMLAEKGSPGCTGCRLQLILHALPVWLGINLFNSLLSA